MADLRPLPPVPSELLAPLLHAAGDVLRSKEPSDAPPALRPLLGFDRRGFASAAARTQLLKGLESESDFRDEVLGAFADRPEARAVLEGWGPGAAVRIAADLAERDDLPLLVSALLAAGPDGWELGLGVATALHEQGVARRESEEDRRAFDERVRREEEARRRAEREAERLQREVERLGGELRQERASRREREDAARSEAEDQRRDAEARDEALHAAREELSRVQKRLRNEADRAASLREELRAARLEVDEHRARLAEAEREPPEPSPTDLARALGLGRAELELLAHAGELARRLLEAGITGTASRDPGRGATGRSSSATDPGAGASSPADERADVERGEEARPGRRARVRIPPGMVGPSLEGVQEGLRAGASLVVDGYNVSMQAWPEEPPDAQRQRLCAALERLHLRTQASVTVVFDGADVEGLRPPRRPGVRVLFSAQAEEADDVVVREVRQLPLERPAIVVSSDRRVQEESEEVGALAVPSEVLVEVLRR